MFFFTNVAYSISRRVWFRVECDEYSPGWRMFRDTSGKGASRESNRTATKRSRTLANWYSCKRIAVRIVHLGRLWNKVQR